MKNFNIKLSILCLILITVCSFDSGYLWFVTNAQSFNIFRILLVVLLGILLVTEPPRNKYLRLTLAFVSLLTLSWTLSTNIGVDMQLGDWMSFILAGITLGHSALEYERKKETQLA